MATKHDDQRRLIENAFQAARTPVGAGRLTPRERRGKADEERPVEFLYRQGHILVREEFVDAVTDLLTSATQSWWERLWRGRPVAARPVVHGVRLLRLPASITVARALRLVAGVFGPGIATFDYVLALAQWQPTGWCNPTEAEPVPRGTAPVPAVVTDKANAGEGVHAVILDNGIDLATLPGASWLSDGVTGEEDLGVGAGQPPVLGPYAGHGTFAAGVLRTMAPKATVTVLRAFPLVGAAFETDLVTRIDEMLHEDPPDIICIPAGTRTADATGLLALTTHIQNRLSNHKGTVLVVAAGNDSTNQPFWPAKADGTVTVGSLTLDGTARASFSNHGGSVDVYAPGEDLINAFPTGRYTYTEGDRAGTTADFEGRAKWSGTSFSAAMVSGMIAARMWETGQSGAAAAASLILLGQESALPGVGAVLMPPPAQPAPQAEPEPPAES